MIEVEKKFLLNKKQEKNLIDGAEFIGKKVFTDIYYDTVDYSLTSNDKWLRSRAGRFELKLSLDKNVATRQGDLYDEVEDENKIREILGISKEGGMEENLEKSGYSKFCTCTTTRKKYKTGDFGIDIDYVNFGDFNYELAEIELMIKDEREAKYALIKIIELAEFYGLKIGYVRGKVIEYLKRKKPDHFDALIKSGVVRPEQI